MKKIFFAVLALGFCLASIAAADKGYHLLTKIKVAGDGGWDYLSVDPAAGRLYVSHDIRVEVIDLGSDTVVGEVPGLSGVHGIAIASDLGRGFISNGKSGKVTIFSLKTLEKLGEVNAGNNPDAILYDPAARAVFAFNGKSDDATVIDAATGKALGTIKLDGKPEFAAADGLGRVFVNLEDKNLVLMIDAGKLRVEKSWAIAPGENPTGLAMDTKNQRLFVVCGNRLLVVLNSDTGKLIGSYPIGARVDGAAFDPALGLVFASNGEGTLTVIHQDSKDKYTLRESVKTQIGARTIALDPRSHRVFLPVAEFGPAPASTSDHPHPRPSIVPGSFQVLVFGPPIR